MNPFELRYQLLHSAKEILEAQFHAGLKTWEILEKAGEPPKFPTFQDMLDLATKMNKFVSEK